MILEVADVRIVPGNQAEFEAAIARGVRDVISQAKGFDGYELTHSVESPDRYLVIICWATLEDHVVGFRQSPAFSEWRAIVAPFFAGTPTMEHFALVRKSD